MRNRVPVVVVTLLAAVMVAAVVSTGSSQPPPPAVKKTVFSSLKVGQSVSLKDKATGWEISATDDEAPLTHRVAEIGDEYIVLNDEAGSVQTRIPATAVRAVVLVRTKGK